MNSTFRILGQLVTAATLLPMLLGCGSKTTSPPANTTFIPGDAQLLSTGSPTKDEDPSVLLTRDGRIIVAWFSDRGGNPDIYLTATSDGASWLPAVRVTTHSGGDFYPRLIQDDSGKFHLTWFRWTALYVGNIIYNSSDDGVTWDEGNEVMVTTEPNVDDWTPSIAADSSTNLLITFASTKRNMPDSTSAVYVTRRVVNQTVWSAPQKVPGFASDSLHANLPVVALANDTFYIVASRYDTTQAVPWFNPKSQIAYAKSVDGVIWTSPEDITTDAGNIVHLYPSLFEKTPGDWSVIWLSTRVGGTPLPYELPFAQFRDYPTGILQNTTLGTGYSHQISRTPNSGVYVGVWVQGPEGAQDIYYRLFRY